MIQPQTLVKVTDNSGAKTARVIKVLGGTRRRYARIGDEVVVSVQTAEPRKNIKKKDVVTGLVVRQVRPLRRSDGSYISFNENAIVVVDRAKKDVRGTRVFGPIPREVEGVGYRRVASLAPEVV